MRLSARTCGALIAGAGAVLAAFHLASAVALRSMPALLFVEAAAPLGIAVAVVILGALLSRGDLVPAQFAERTLAWAGVGTLTLVAATVPLFIDASLRGQPMLALPRTVANAATLGILVGLVVGTYDARAQRQRLRADRLTRINDTLRIATQEVIDATERSELEQAVCDRLTQSDIYDSTWLGRYNPETRMIDPVAWAGHDDDYVESLDISADPDEPLGQGPGGEAIRTGEIQCVQNVFEEPRMEPWWDLFESRGVEALAAIPIVGDDDVYGMFSVYATRANAFDAPEREALSELGESIGHAIDSLETRRQLAERERELERQNERLAEFASVVSHDLRNPLNVAEGNLEIARETGKMEHLDRALGALDRMNELIDDVLTLARTGRAVSDPRTVDLRSVAERAWTTTDTAGATLRIDGDLGTVHADESRLRQVFENLFRNSVEHGSTSDRTQSDTGTDRGSAPSAPATFRRGGATGDTDVTVTVGRTDDGFYVADDGPGIPESERDRVFEGGYSTGNDGTGLGLSIVRNVAEAHGWTVAVTESDEGGARFEVTGIEFGDYSSV